MYTTSERSILKLGGVLSIFVGGLYFILTVLIAVDPVGMFISRENIEKMILFPYLNITWRIVFATICVLTIAFANAARLYFGKDNEKYAGILQYSTILVVAGMVASALNWIHYVHVVGITSELYHSGRPMAELLNMVMLPIDSYFIWSWGSLGIFMMVISLLSLRNKVVTKKMSYFGIIIGIIPIVMLIVYIGDMKVNIAGIKMNTIIILAAIQCGILAPIYHFNFSKYVFRALADTSAKKVKNSISA